MRSAESTEVSPENMCAQKRRQNRALAARLSTNLVVWSLAGAHALRVCGLLTLVQLPIGGF